MDDDDLMCEICIILLHVHPLLGNGLVNKFPRRQILGKQSVGKLRNNRGTVTEVRDSGTLLALIPTDESLVGRMANRSHVTQY
jgi:hypothetical protein